MVVPQRQPVLTAKMLATIDVLSGGRLIVGCGVGWLKEEFEALGAPPFAERGRATDEYIDAFKVLWTEDAPAATRHARQLRQPHVRAQAGAQAASPDLDRRREPAGRHEAHGARGRRLVSGLQQPAASPRHARAAGRRRRRAAGASPRPRARSRAASISATSCCGPSTGRAQKRRRRRPRACSPAAPQDMAADIAALAQAGVRHLCLTFQTASAARDAGAHAALRRRGHAAGQVGRASRDPTPSAMAASGRAALDPTYAPSSMIAPQETGPSHGQAETRDAREAQDRQHGDGVHGALQEGPAQPVHAGRAPAQSRAPGRWWARRSRCATSRRART